MCARTLSLQCAFDVRCTAYIRAAKECVQCQCLLGIFLFTNVSHKHTQSDINWPLVKNLHTLPMKGHKHFVHIYLHHAVDASGLLARPGFHCFIFPSFFLRRVFHFLLFIPCLPSIKQIYMFKWTTYMNWRIIVYNRLKRPIHLEIIIKLLMLQYWITSTQKHHTFHPQPIIFLCTFVLKYALKGYFT